MKRKARKRGLCDGLLALRAWFAWWARGPPIDGRS